MSQIEIPAIKILKITEIEDLFDNRWNVTEKRNSNSKTEMKKLPTMKSKKAETGKAIKRHGRQEW